MQTLEHFINNYDNFCTRPFTELVLWYDKTYKPCCVYDPGDPTEPGAFSDSPDHVDIKNIWTSDYLTNIRQQFMENKFPKECAHCGRVESRGDSSLRNESSMLLFNNQGNLDVVPDVDMGAIPYNLPLKIEFRIGNSCNMSCRMCFPLVSSSIAKEYLDHKEELDVVLKNDPSPYMLVNPNNNAVVRQVENTGVSDWLEEKTIDDICKQYSKNRQQLLRVREVQDEVNQNAYLPQWSIIGGEPTVTPGFYTILEKIQEHNIQDLLQVVIITNGLVFNQKLVDLLTGIGKLDITISIDGTKEVHEYIRNKRSFDRILKNLKRYETVVHQLAIETTVSILNLFDLPDWCRFISDNELFLKEKKNFTGAWQPTYDVGFHIVENPDLNFYNIPHSIRKEFKPKLIEAYDYMVVKPRNLEAIIDSIDVPYEELDEKYKVKDALKMFVDRTLMLDKIRGQDILSIDKYGYYKQMIDMVKNGNY